ncbi:hypothetical protein [Ruegeria sp.]|uniref:hypothetical protein n=1 Tax=Ruegeria sp. TaxID=1879320 RepID=UPI003B00A964
MQLMAGRRKPLLFIATARALCVLYALAGLVAAPVLAQIPLTAEAQTPLPILDYAEDSGKRDPSGGASGGPSGGNGAGPARHPPARDVRAALSEEMAQMRKDIADIARFARWQDNLARIARTDPAEALRQRLPLSDCRASLFASICDALSGMFKPEDIE